MCLQKGLSAQAEHLCIVLTKEGWASPVGTTRRHAKRPGELVVSLGQSIEPVLLKPDNGPLSLVCPREDRGILSCINLSLLFSFFFFFSPPAMKLQPLRTLQDS